MGDPSAALSCCRGTHRVCEGPEGWGGRCVSTNRSLKPKSDLSFELPKLTFPNEGTSLIHLLYPHPWEMPAARRIVCPHPGCSSNWENSFAESGLSENAVLIHTRCGMLQPLPGSHFGIYV